MSVLRTYPKRARPAAAAASEPGRAGGFTLLEVLFALVVLGLAMTALVQTFSTGLDATTRNEARTIALLHARSKLAEYSVRRGLGDGTWSGSFANGYAWQVSLAPAASDAGGDASVMPAGLRELSVRVTWHRGSLSLATLLYENPP